MDGPALHLKFYDFNLYFHVILSSISNFSTYSVKMQVLCSEFFQDTNTDLTHLCPFWMALLDTVIFSFVSSFVETLALWGQNMPYLQSAFH